ncbi:hypothetical protein SPRG_01368 [Saprolegnia parasitica CBS 223.65]|uniref:F-box domain-containing protein n=1 Tax=Saprolegnia parasitica (strain CBS 223.65) TaxID=695850 RepID=A0A067CTR6_SAPPC|nr:hypothetical protein SPRG_01368 [Saprolegnia parasitica CBS 223.65]KDO34094.1 hypothetical protein SPRG_01368 [Saprolegnia parasitica CBS 223.65]|eukprot:XP_012194978.1 hypothetical protein SPRG_01368 [Saprolegnia parasitica CBS 223.65]
MLTELPDVCRQRLYGYLEARDLCCVASTCRTLRDAKAPPMHGHWRRLVERDILGVPVAVPRTCTLQRRNAFSDLDIHCSNQDDDTGAATKRSSFQDKLVSARTSCGVDADEEKKWSIKPMRALPWPAMYRVCILKVHALHNDDLRFQEEMRLLQDFKRERGRLKERLGTSAKHMKAHDGSRRAAPLSCVKFLNKTTRRFLALPQSSGSNNQKAERHAELARVDEIINEYTSSTFSMRVQLRKDYRKLQGYLLTARRALHDS